MRFLLWLFLAWVGLWVSDALWCLVSDKLGFSPCPQCKRALAALRRGRPDAHIVRAALIWNLDWRHCWIVNPRSGSSEFWYIVPTKQPTEDVIEHAAER